MLQEYITKLFKYEHRTALLIGEASVKYLRRYIYGSADAFEMCGFCSVKEAFGQRWEYFVEQWLNDFQTCGWDNLMLKHSNSGTDAMALFYHILRIYLKSNYPDISFPEAVQ